MLTKVLVLFGSISMIAFGIWHFFVPGIYKWYSYMSSSAPELAVAVRATNVFFSLSLVLIGIANIILCVCRQPLHADSHAGNVVCTLGNTCSNAVDFSSGHNKPSAKIRNAGYIYSDIFVFCYFINNHYINTQPLIN